MFKISILIFAALFLIGMVGSVELKDGSFPIGSDYKLEKEKLGGQDPTSYTKVYHRVIPGGAEHAEVKASNGPGSQSWSSTYRKHQSFGSSDNSNSQSFSSNTNPAADGASNPDDIAASIRAHFEKSEKESQSLADKIRADIDKAQKESFARHDKMMADLDKSMNFGSFDFPKFGYPENDANANDGGIGFNPYSQMQNHMDMMRQMMQEQQAQFQMHQNFFDQARSWQNPYYNSIPSSDSYSDHYRTPPKKISDSEAVREAVLELNTPTTVPRSGYSYQGKSRSQENK